MKYAVIFKPTASRELEKIPKHLADDILEKITNLAINPRPVGCKKLISSRNAWRLRVGDYRILYEVYDDASLVRIYRIRHRKEAYR